MLDRKEVLARFDEQRRTSEWRIFRREETPLVVRHIDLLGTTSVVSFSRLNEANADEAIREQVAYFKELGHSFEWKYYEHDQPPDLKERLAAHGFEIEESEAFVVLDIENPPPALLAPISHDIRRVSDPDNLRDVFGIQEEVWQEGFGELEAFVAETLRHYPDEIAIYVAYVDDVPVSSAWMFFNTGSAEANDFVGLFGGSTLPEYRKQGIYTALVAVRLQEARRRGVRFLTVDASPMSRPILEKLGFQFLLYTTPCMWHLDGA